VTDSQGTTALPSTIQLALTIQALPSGRYRLTVTDIPGDQLSVDIPTPFSMTVLGQLADKLEGRVKLSPGERDAAAKQFGETLFAAIFSGALVDIYAKRRQQAINASVPLTVHVNLDKAGLLGNIPWNLLRDPAVGLIPVVTSDPPPQPRWVGGARETIARPRTVAIIVPLLVIIVLAGLGFRQLTAPPSDVDLTIVSLRFFPRQPAPGDLVTISIGIRNTGTSDAGQFKWAWYETNPQQQAQPNMTGEVPALPAGATITVKNDFIFGWWGLYRSAGWVNFDNKQSETNYLNNFSSADQGQVTTSDDPFAIDWTRMPDASPITTSLDLTGTEFSDWGLTVKTDTKANPACLKTVPHILVNNAANLNQLTLALPGGAPLPSACATLPLTFTVTHPFGSASLDFTAPTPGDYGMTVFDDAGKTLGTTKVTAAQSGDALNLHLGAGATVSDPQAMQPLSVTMRAFQISIQGPGIITVQKLTLGKPTG
jgi:hypothetical protein